LADHCNTEQWCLCRHLWSNSSNVAHCWPPNRNIHRLIKWIKDIYRWTVLLYKGFNHSVLVKQLLHPLIERYWCACSGTVFQYRKQMQL
jgi:hypothetical protein